jgi:hypothetical protein
VPPTCYRNAELAETRFGALAREYAAALSRSDPLGDSALVALDELGPDGVALLAAALAEGSRAVADAPEPVRALFASVDLPPFEVDEDLVVLGARAILRHGLGYAMATRQSLFWGYSNGAAIKPLAWTGEMRTPEATLNRLLITGDWLNKVIAPGGVLPRRAGWAESVRVRLLHARVRVSLLRSGRWDAEAWGAPLNEADSGFTLLEFTLMPLRMLRGLGFEFTECEVHGIHALWRLVGHLFGVPLALNPESVAESERILALRELTAGPPDAQSLELVRALLDSNLMPDGAPLQRLAGRGLHAFDRALARRNLPPGYPQMLGIAPTPLERAFPLLRAGVRAIEGVRKRAPSADAWLIRRNEELIRRGDQMLKDRVALTSRPAGHPGRRPGALAGR